MLWFEFIPVLFVFAVTVLFGLWKHPRFLAVWKQGSCAFLKALTLFYASLPLHRALVNPHSPFCIAVLTDETGVCRFIWWVRKCLVTYFIHIFDNWFSDVPRYNLHNHPQKRLNVWWGFDIFFFMGKLKKRKLERSQSTQKALMFYLDTSQELVMYENRRLFLLWDC